MKDIRIKVLAVVLSVTGLASSLTACSSNDGEIKVPDAIDYTKEESLDYLIKDAYKYVVAVENYKNNPSKANRMQVISSGYSLTSIAEDVIEDKLDARYVSIIDGGRNPMNTIEIDNSFYHTPGDLTLATMDKNMCNIVDEICDIYNWHGDGSNDTAWTTDSMSNYIEEANQAYNAIGAIVNSKIYEKNGKLRIELTEDGEEYTKRMK